ncbi:hypothetical protein KL86DES1_22310 [uncultured Desulfovibrio sp.]|uniref:Uncharacterized protein n=1 Tax=uncultured Desulfovibrio sp. TaxID=167968 RepID=A0A212LBH8_9BACT|nr:hypothetical protein KL86DES1_22222 [uncultured Desulfovibrio sp.]SCM75041.1 hypothetical protein KL86DES1_22310 [uncultured Desulfovibrio sp.]VZH35115.1 conserved protein of unknown function [Desulfovibrio sp. 86]VZH35204.1 conserved protein of unknown function [Desulfovibrio sp. 86]
MNCSGIPLFFRQRQTRPLDIPGAVSVVTLSRQLVESQIEPRQILPSQTIENIRSPRYTFRT